MPRICYDRDCKTRLERNAAHLRVIGQANEIIAEYQEQGFNLTLRQLYYQFVSRDLIPNRDREYKRLGCVKTTARAGRVEPDGPSW